MGKELYSVNYIRINSADVDSLSVPFQRPLPAWNDSVEWECDPKGQGGGCFWPQASQQTVCIPPCTPAAWQRRPFPRTHTRSALPTPAQQRIGIRH